MKFVGFLAFLFAITATLPAKAAETCWHPDGGIVKDGVMRLQCGNDLVPVTGVSYQRLLKNNVWICERVKVNEMTEWLAHCTPPIGFRDL
ncbi:MAG TPA: hypothetical protein VG984_01375 [Candidatus Paceibacterota bacterium]|nr:hypothetical protein [Candidatus Paceibacterota bacterium]